MKSVIKNLSQGLNKMQLKKTLMTHGITWSDVFTMLLWALLLSIPASYEPHHFAKTLFGTALCTSLAYSSVTYMLVRRKKGIKLAVYIVLMALFTIETFTYIRFGSRLNPAILTLILQTSWREIQEFTEVYFFSCETALMLVAICVACFCFSYLQRIISSSCRKPSWLLSVTVLPLCLLGFFQPWLLPEELPMGQTTVSEMLISIDFVREKHAEIEEIERHINRINILSQPAKEEAPVIVFVIGESFNRRHSNLYGYPLLTTPFLTNKEREGSLILFSEVRSPARSTSSAMRYLFSLKGCGAETIEGERYVLVPALFRKAGYRVAYFDNQFTRGTGGETDYTCAYFLNPQLISRSCFDYRNNEIEIYDADFIDKYKDRFYKTEKSLNIIHLYGQHFAANKRYPQSFGRFKASDIKRNDLTENEKTAIAEYDNATLYNDSVVGNIIREFEDVDAVAIYLSDHGEQVYEGKNHYFGRWNFSHLTEESKDHIYHVPMFVWGSDSFRQKHRDVWDKLTAAKNMRLCSADIPFMLLDIASVVSNYNNAPRSPLKKGFKEHETIIED
ncbi:MAG: phosphoethanolamine transferase [Alloprevotella sp.]